MQLAGQSETCIKHCFKIVSLATWLPYLSVFARGRIERNQAGAQGWAHKSPARAPWSDCRYRTKSERSAWTSPEAREQGERTSASPTSQPVRFIFFFFFLLFGSAVRVSAHTVHSVPQECHNPEAKNTHYRAEDEVHLQRSREWEWRVAPVRKRRSDHFDPLHINPPPP